MQGLWDACRRGRYLCFDKPFVWPFLDKPSERFSLRQAQGPQGRERLRDAQQLQV